MTLENDDEARAYARSEVRRIMESGRYTVDHAEKELFWGYGGPDEPGWEIQRGVIAIPEFPCGGRQWKFKFREIAEELNQPVQGMLFS
jgi:hypothetical protein